MTTTQLERSEPQVFQFKPPSRAVKQTWHVCYLNAILQNTIRTEKDDGVQRNQSPETGGLKLKKPCSSDAQGSSWELRKQP